MKDARILSMLCHCLAVPHRIINSWLLANLSWKVFCSGPLVVQVSSYRQKRTMGGLVAHRRAAEY